MTQREIRMRAIEAIANSGIREPQRLIKDAQLIEDWVMKGEDKAQAPLRGRPATKTEDKD